MALSLQCSVAPRFLQALLNGLSKLRFEGNSAYSYTVLRAHIYGGGAAAAAAAPAAAAESDDAPLLSEEEALAEMRSWERLLLLAAREDWDVARMEQELRASQADDGAGLRAEHVTAAAAFWRTHRARIHAAVYKDSVWNGQLGAGGGAAGAGVSWRIDMCATSRHAAEINQPTAMFELRVKGGVMDRRRLTGEDDGTTAGADGGEGAEEDEDEAADEDDAGAGGVGAGGDAAAGGGDSTAARPEAGGHAASDARQHHVVRFEMTKEQLQGMLQEFDKVQEAIQANS